MRKKTSLVLSCLSITLIILICSIEYLHNVINPSILITTTIDALIFVFFMSFLIYRMRAQNYSITHKKTNFILVFIVFLVVFSFYHLMFLISASFYIQTILQIIFAILFCLISLPLSKNIEKIVGKNQNR
jgi:hypothetical protein